MDSPAGRGGGSDDAPGRRAHLHDPELFRDFAKLAFEHSAVPVQWIGGGGALVWGNQAACDALGYTLEELQRLTIGDIDDAVDGRWHEVWPEITAQGGTVVESTHRRKDGTSFPVQIATSPCRIGGQEYAFAVVIDISARREADHALATLLSNLPGIAYRCVLDRRRWKIDFVSDACRELTGYRPDELVGDRATPLGRVIHPDDHDLLRRKTGTAPADGCTGELEYRITTAGGTERWVLDRYTVTADEQGRPATIEGLLLDISDRRRMEEELRRSREELRLRTRIADVFLTSSGSQLAGAVLDVLREATSSPCGLFGYLDEDGALVTPSMGGESGDRCGVPGKGAVFPHEAWGDGLWARALRTGATQVLTSGANVPDGHLRIDRAVAVPIVREGASIGIVTVANKRDEYSERDIRLLEDLAAYMSPVFEAWLESGAEERARQRAEEALRASEAKYRALFEQVPTGVLLYDQSFHVLEVNERLAQIVGTTRGELLQRDFAGRLATSPLFAAFTAALRGENGRYEGPHRFSTGDKNVVIQLTTTPLTGSRGEVLGGIAAFTDLTEQRRTQEQMQHLLLHDALSGLPNRSLFIDRVRQALAHGRRKRLAFAVAAVRIDRFHHVADSLGHSVADQMIVEVAGRIVGALREEDTVARIGRRDFALLLPGASGPAEAAAAVKGVAEALAQPLSLGEHEVYPGGSIGIAVYPADGADAEELYRNAEAALSRAAQGGRQWEFFHASMNAEQASRLKLEADLHRAVEKDQFLLEYQPLVDAVTGEAISVEALVRWQHPERGLVPPSDFIPLAEETGLMKPIGAWVLETACGQAAAWERTLDHAPRMNINLSAVQLLDEKLLDIVTAALRRTGLSGDRLSFEITETAAMRDPRQTALVLAALREKGARIALDDFGTGYSSLSHLVRLPITTVKIDRSFIHDVIAIPHHAAIATSVIALAHRLGLLVAAEGVETLDQLRFLREEGCDLVQGYLVSRPIPAADCGRLLAAGPAKVLAAEPA